MVLLYSDMGLPELSFPVILRVMCDKIMTLEELEWFPLKKTCIACGKDKLLNDFDIIFKKQVYTQEFEHVDIILPPSTLDWLKQYLNKRIFPLIWDNKSYNEIGILTSILKRIENSISLSDEEFILKDPGSSGDYHSSLVFMNIETVNELTRILSKDLESEHVNHHNTKTLDIIYILNAVNSTLFQIF